MSTYRRVRRFAGRCELLESKERQYRVTWLQPQNENRVATQVNVYEKEDGWHGHLYLDTTKLELFWMRGLWKEVPNPHAGVMLAPLTDEDDEETIDEILVAPLKENHD